MAPRLCLCHPCILLTKEMSKHLSVVEKVSDRIIEAHLEGNPAMSIVIGYVPTEGSDIDDKTNFYDQLQDAIENIPTHNTIVLVGDFNARIGQDSHTTNPRVIGKSTYHDQTNENGELLTRFCERHNLRPTQFRFPHPKGRVWTWEHPSGQRAHLDHIIVNAKWLNSVRNCRAYGSVELDSDRRIVSVTVKISLRIQGANPVKPKRYNWNKLESVSNRKEFQLELKNRFEPLRTLSADENMREFYNSFQGGVEKAAEKVVGLIKPKKSPNWVSHQTDKVREERNKAKQAHNTSRSVENREKVQKLKCRIEQCL
ncbi:craniofacial development protein 2-like [Montipora foliosa]|uniref:craniofacial development protein 2-like n=1 Tax=Montipora foliosa TaxID=591990 RepID=UPI0035F1A2AE